MQGSQGERRSAAHVVRLSVLVGFRRRPSRVLLQIEPYRDPDPGTPREVALGAVILSAKRARFTFILKGPSD